MLITSVRTNRPAHSSSSENRPEPKVRRAAVLPTTAMAALAALGALAVFLAHPYSGEAQQPTATATVAATTGSEHRFPSDSAVLAILKERVEKAGVAGLVVGMLEPDGSTRIVAWGDSGPGQAPMDGQSVFEIGSITKVFTATVLADMALKGEVSLDDPVQRFLPPGVTIPTRNGKEITLGMLSEQNSGLPRLPTNMAPADMANPYADYTDQRLYDFLSGYELTRDPGEEFEYSNLGVGLLGHALALHAGTSFETMVKERILDPLGMSHTAVTFTPWMREHLALGHNGQGAVVSNWDAPALAGAGALRSTAEDMLTFLDANLHPERGLLQEAMAFAQAGRAETGNPGRMIGLNWMNLHAGADTVVWHTGGTGGYVSFAGIIPSKKVGVVVLSNTAGPAADAIGQHLLRPELPLAPIPEPRKTFTAIELSAELLAQYVGTYELRPGFEIVMTLENGQLFAQATNQVKTSLRPYTEVDFFVLELEAQFTFQKGADGTVTGFVLHQGGQDFPAEKIG
ncbi:MAG: serine hydrolase [Gemmatimonadota bacterium]